MFCHWKSTTILLESDHIQIKRNPIVMLLGSWCHWFSWVFTHDASEGSMDFEHFKIFLNSIAAVGLETYGSVDGKPVSYSTVQDYI